ncbi:MAG: LL-diaminopimelate aminotransferase [Clostridia bacterium]|nr:LL-diaminopimelate aminotransferase [Clostridia bacterium]
MIKLNENYGNLKDSYLFFNIKQKVDKYVAGHPGMKIYRMGIGDVTLPLAWCVIDALSNAVADQAQKGTFHGYMPECGMPELREIIAAFYNGRGVELTPGDVFVSSGASDELGDILDLFDSSGSSIIMEPAYPAYVDANIIAGRRIFHVTGNEANGFAPVPDNDTPVGDLIYICSPNNPTGAVFSKDALRKWVDFANLHGSIILFDAAYEAFIESPSVPHSIFEIEGARTCAIEICSLSKTAGFTGTRLGYTVIPGELKRGGLCLNDMWVRNRTTKTNGVSYVLQKGGLAVFSDEGRREIMENIRIYKQNARYLTDALDRLGVTYYGGRNAPYIFMKCPEGYTSWESFDLLLNEIQVVGTPGQGFGDAGEGFIRFSTFASPEDTKEAALRIFDLLTRMKG